MEKRFNITTYFVEPAQYTLDLIKNVHNKIGSEYRFLYSKSNASTNRKKSVRGQSFWIQIPN